ncbi:carboxylesterase family protein [Microbispora hainanensis]|uniref:carboxylesterase family protein n=1 Tax=Microbispora hainanensis TaxID=568844 RepID=UPI0033C6340E
MTNNADSAPKVRVASGRLRGRKDREVAAFLGIPYAASPFGALRMRPPEPPESWEGERSATDYGPTCPKGDYGPEIAALFPEVVIPGEECLNLNGAARTPPRGPASPSPRWWTATPSPATRSTR